MRRRGFLSLSLYVSLSVSLSLSLSLCGKEIHEAKRNTSTYTGGEGEDGKVCVENSPSGKVARHFSRLLDVAPPTNRLAKGLCHTRLVAAPQISA